MSQLTTFTVNEICEWIEGLGLKNVADQFRKDEMDMNKLMTLESDDLSDYSFYERELVLSVVKKLEELYFSLESITLQTLSLKFLYAVKTLQSRLQEFQINIEDESTTEKLSFAAILDSMDLIKCGNKLIYWLKWSPPTHQSEYSMISENLPAILSNFNRKFETNKIFVPKKCEKLIKICDVLISIAESFLVPTDIFSSMPCNLHLVIIRRDSVQESLGLGLSQSEFGDCVIEEIFPDSLAFQNGNIAAGDELIQVNEKLIIGWSIHKIGTFLSSLSAKIVLLIKKRPFMEKKTREISLDLLNCKKKRFTRKSRNSTKVNFEDQIVKRSMDSIRNKKEKIDPTRELHLFSNPIIDTESSFDESPYSDGYYSKTSQSSMTTNTDINHIDIDDGDLSSFDPFTSI